MPTSMQSDKNKTASVEPCAAPTTLLRLTAEETLTLRILIENGITDTVSNRKAELLTSVLRKLDHREGSGFKRNFMDVSTAHLTPADRAFLERSAKSLAIGGAAALRGPYGWLVYVHDERSSTGISDVLWNVMQTARDALCDYIMFDADAPEHPDLPCFDYDTGEVVTHVEAS